MSMDGKGKEKGKVDVRKDKDKGKWDFFFSSPWLDGRASLEWYTRILSGADGFACHVVSSVVGMV